MIRTKLDDIENYKQKDMIRTKLERERYDSD